MSGKIRVGIIGGGGYAAGELLRLLVYHKQIEITFVASYSQKGKRIDQVHPDLIGECDLLFTERYHFEVDLLFLCRGHNQSANFLSSNKVPPEVKIIDFSHDYRLNLYDETTGRHFVYGLPELNREAIRDAPSIANPGCFATSIELALLPLASYINSDVHIHSITGSTGAGHNPTATTHFSWRENNISVYKVFGHQHLFEIKQTLEEASSEFNGDIHLIPLRGNFTRGIFTTVYTKTPFSAEQLLEIYKSYYEPHPFVVITDTELNLKQVVNTNKCIISLRKYGEFVFFVSIIDNLLKGASGQAVQNMNLMFGLEETAFLTTKPLAF